VASSLTGLNVDGTCGLFDADLLLGRCCCHLFSGNCNGRRVRGGSDLLYIFPTPPAFADSTVWRQARKARFNFASASDLPRLFVGTIRWPVDRTPDAVAYALTVLGRGYYPYRPRKGMSPDGSTASNALVNALSPVIHRDVCRWHAAAAAILTRRL